VKNSKRPLHQYSKGNKEAEKWILKMRNYEDPQVKYWWLQFIPAGLSLIAILISAAKLCGWI